MMVIETATGCMEGDVSVVWLRHLSGSCHGRCAVEALFNYNGRLTIFEKRSFRTLLKVFSSPL